MQPNLRTVIRVASLALLLAGAAFSTPCAHAGQGFDSRLLKIDPTGMLTIGGISFNVVCYDPSYLFTEQGKPGTFSSSPGFPKESAAAWETQGTFQTKSGPTFSLHQKLERLSETSFHVTYHVESGAGETPLPGHLICVQALFPAESFAGKSMQADGTELQLPVATGGQNLMWDKWGTRKMVVPVEGGHLVIEGDLKPHVQDDRPWQNNFFKLWFVLAQQNNPARAADLDLKLSYEPAGTPAK